MEFASGWTQDKFEKAMNSTPGYSYGHTEEQFRDN
jgi:hypothetical protein